MGTKKIIQNIAAEVRQKFSGEGSWHDWWHIERVWRTSKRIGHEGKANVTIVELAALLHDIADWKFHNGDESVGPRIAREMLTAHSVPENIIDDVCEIIETISFKGASVKTPMRTLEGRVVQDADRLDALGAIGIARAFAYGGHKGRPLHEPNVKPTMHKTKKAYMNHTQGTTINHFYEKLLLLKDRMNTMTARRIAKERHLFMEEYLKEFFKEWKGNA